MRANAKQRVVLLIVSLLAMLGAAWWSPTLGILLMIVLPLSLGPAVLSGGWKAALLPASLVLGMLLGGMDALLAILSSLGSLACLLVAALDKRRRISFNRSTLGYIAAVILGLLPVLARAAWLLGGPLFPTLSSWIVDNIQGSVYSGNILYQLVRFGVLSVPDAYQTGSAFQLGSFIFLRPQLQAELLKLLQPRLNDLLAFYVPSLMVQLGIIVGLFTSLLTERMHGRLTGSKLFSPSFQTLRLPQTYRRYVFFLAVIAVLTSFSTAEVTRLVYALTYATVATVYQLLGAATLIFMLARKHPRGTVWFGVLAAALYLLLPIVLFVLGLADQLFGLRAATLYHSEEE